jgi:Na+-transporting methylmalonyl-CoA/oxaloacetate decarboxylase gamma subunit
MGNNKKAIPLFFIILFILFIITCLPGISISADKTTAKQEVKKETKQEKQQKNPYVKAEISIKIIPAANNTFGYDILIYGRPLIHQPNIPSLPGNEGFTTKERAQKVAEFVVKKIRNNEMPPAVTIEDLNKLDVLK